MKLQVFASAGMILALTAAPAYAQSMQTMRMDQQTPTSTAQSWEGFYAGVWTGFHAGNVDNTYCQGICGDDIDTSGAVGGIEAGYSFALNDDWVVSPFISVPVFAPSAETSFPAGGGATYSYTIEPQWAVYSGIKAGKAMGDFLPYGLLGVGAANITVTDDVGTSSNATHAAAVVGAGGEYRVNEHVSFDGRYMFAISADADYDFCTGGMSCPTSYREISHNFLVGVTYRF